MKNSDTKVFENVTAKDIFTLICGEYGLSVGECDSTDYTFASLTRSDTSLIDIIESALTLTTQNTGEEFVIYDDFGKLSLKNLKNTLLPIVISDGDGENFHYTKEIDSDTYNQIKLIYENPKKGLREITVIKNDENIKKWGILQYLGKLDKYENPMVKGNKILEKKNREKEFFSMDGIKGNPKARAGTSLFVDLNGQRQIILIKKAVHKFSEGKHFMSLTAQI